MSICSSVTVLYIVLLLFNLYYFAGQPFFYMAFAGCVNVYVVSVHTSST